MRAIPARFPKVPTDNVLGSISLALALVLVLGGAVLGADKRAPSITVHEYRSRLQDLLSAAERQDAYDLQAVGVALPDEWRVQTGRGEIVVPASWLGRELSNLLHAPNADGARKDVVRRVRQMIADLDGYDAAPPDRGRERRMLAAILARREFSAVRGPNWFDRLKQRILDFLGRLLDSIFGSSSFPVVASVVVYVLVGLAIFVTALWVYRTLADGRTQPVVPERVPISAKAWTVWLNEAREAAAQGRRRDAVRLAYWAGISYLESRGMWPPDRARTPREYLRLLPATSEHRSALSALTRTFEPVWYGNRPADAATFAETVACVERLGANDRAPAVQPANADPAGLAGD